MYNAAFLLTGAFPAVDVDFAPFLEIP